LCHLYFYRLWRAKHFFFFTNASVGLFHLCSAHDSHAAILRSFTFESEINLLRHAGRTQDMD
jgi:hypothetical protein